MISEHTSAALPCCLHLRCKSMSYRPDERPGMIHCEPSMTYWCNITSDRLGPDDLVADHPRCQAGRECFAAGPRLSSE